MFKRVEKRRRKQEMEEELGIDADMKEVLGMQDTDSEESDSDSDSDASSDAGSGSDEEGFMDEDIGDVEEDAESESGEIQDAEDAEDADEDPFISVASALEDPIYVVSIQPEVKSCIVCPGKLLKNPEMTKTHITSNIHQRRFKRFKSFAKDASPEESAWEVILKNEGDQPKLGGDVPPAAESKRAAKKKAHWQKKREKMLKIKEKKRTPATSEAKPSSPTKTTKVKKDKPLDGVSQSKPKPAAADGGPPKKKKARIQPAPTDEKESPKQKPVQRTKKEGKPKAGRGKQA